MIGGVKFTSEGKLYGLFFVFATRVIRGTTLQRVEIDRANTWKERFFLFPFL